MSAPATAPRSAKTTFFVRDALPSWEAYATVRGIRLRGSGVERRAVCPIHGGERDSLAVNAVTGAWMCHACGASGGGVLAFHMEATGATFGQAARELGACADASGHRRPGKAPARPVTRTTLPTRHKALSEFGRALWASCQPLAGEAVAYLQARACVIPPSDGDLRWHDALMHPPTGTVGPALVALVTHAVTREPLTLHRTWIKADGTKAPLEPPRMLLGGHRKQGGVVRFWPDEAVSLGLGIAEGTESALSLAHAFTPVWACIDAANLSALPVLNGVEALTIAGDNDAAGIDAANACADRWARAGAEVRIVMPEQQKADLNDTARMEHDG